MKQSGLKGWLALAGILAVATMVACSSGSDSVDREDKASEPQAGESPQEGSSGGLVINRAGVSEVILTTPEEGAGVKPQFTWQALDGATNYIVVVYTPERESYWAWSGAETSVYMGGGDTPPPDDSAGPILSAGMWWTVIGFDANDRMIGNSILKPISP